MPQRIRGALISNLNAAASSFHITDCTVLPTEPADRYSSLSVFACRIVFNHVLTVNGVEQKDTKFLFTVSFHIHAEINHL